ncbi:Zn(2)-Cys(6) zinc finger domain protein [Metarhizium robertsii]|uniref:Zn(2)-Cys(6) zinc finger domain protein n=1 Tax=Metarhizium robertsii TaxID=568076 RepID=A0A0A1V4R6_9HYPO|nr:Zn(2)-Cys(6) zinc finger domain protein [Metarhizium robertsii]
MRTGSKNLSSPVSPGEAGGDDVLLAVKKSYQCSTCSREFSRPDHLRRHALSRTCRVRRYSSIMAWCLLLAPLTDPRVDTGARPYSCLYCGQRFVRSDRLRDHYDNCGTRGDREIPKGGQRGRRRRACAACTASKLRCEGGTPCNGCRRRNLACDTSRIARPQRPASTTGARLDEEGAADDSQAADSASDARSIKALLDNGTQSFTEKFNLPFFHDETGDVGAPPQAPRANPSLDYEGLADFESQLHLSLGPSEGFELLLNSVSDFWTGPFGTTQPWVNDVDEGDLVWLVRENVPNMFQQPALGQESKAETPQITALRDVLLRTAQQLHLHPSSLDEMTAIIGFLCCQPKIDAFVGLFFLNWHPNGPVLHPPSFDTELVPTELLISVIALGAMYSHDKAERLAARKLLNIAELVIFSAEVFAAAHEIKHPSDESTHNELDWHQFQQIQAGYLITTVQYWAGTRQAKSRAMETRFCELVKVVLTAQPYHQRDRISEELWIRKETQVRTIIMIRLLDCAFLFFSNYPCKLAFSELEHDLPCENAVFNAKHPFAEENFRFRRGSTTAEAFEELFREQSNPPPAQRQCDVESCVNYGSRTVVDLFLTIHCAAMGQRRQNPASEQPAWAEGVDQITAAARHALKRWRSSWLAVRANTRQDVWRASGMHRNAYNFWLVAHLLIEKNEALDLVKRIEVQCEDSLQSLKLLL